MQRVSRRAVLLTALTAGTLGLVRSLGRSDTADGATDCAEGI